MTQTEIAHIVASVIAALEAKNQPSKKAGRPAKKTGKVDRLASKDQQILRGFARKGIKGVVLMDRTDPTADFNVRPFKKGFNGKVDGWLELGRVVKRGEHGVRGLFHISQTEPLAPVAEKTADDQPKVDVSKLATKFRLAKTDNDNQPTA